MNVFQKLAQARLKLKQSGLKQSGKNKGVGYSYFDLIDILPQTTAIENELGLLSVVSFTDTVGTLTVINTDKPEETIVFNSPMSVAELKGCHPVQNLGAAETYVRRYLYLIAYEIVETDALDMSQEGDGKARYKASGQRKESSAKSQESRQSANGAATEGNKTTKSKYAYITELIKGTEFTLDEVNQFIENKYGESIKINSLSDEQFKYVYSTIKRNIETLGG